jgi:hypothetical protein
VNHPSPVPGRVRREEEGEEEGEGGRRGRVQAKSVDSI